MASPGQIPPPYPQRHPRSIAGPVVLIAIGVVFLLETMGVLHWENLGYWFAHYWPLLLILWGVIKLGEYYSAQRSGSRAPGIGAGSVLLLVLLVIFGLVATQAARIDWGSIRDWQGDNGDFPWFGHTYDYEDQLSQSIPAGATLHIVDERGAINVNASDDNQIHVAIHKRINSMDQGEADKLNSRTKPQITVSGQTVTLDANTQSSGDHWVATDLDVTLPRKASVVITARRGDVSVLGRTGDVDITNEHGEVTATDIDGKLHLKLDHSSAQVSQVASDVSVEGRADDISLQDVKGSVELNGDFMDSLKLSKIAKAISFKSARTDLELAKLDGDLDLDSGDLRGADMTGPVRVFTRSKDIQLTGVNGDLRLRDENGSVEIHVAKLGSMQVDNRTGDVQIYLPDKAGFQVSARTRGGEVQSDFTNLQISNNDDEGTANGTVGGGGPNLVINNEHGSIELRKRSSVAEAPEPPTPPKAPRLNAPNSPEEPSEN
jgi:DUF4097 and DUF4098 domain-containing protein YvlB